MDELTRIALVGTSKHAGPLPVSDHPAAALVSGLASDDRESALLLCCGAREVYDLAGRRAATAIEAIAPAQAETSRTASSRLAELLQSIVAGGDAELFVDCLRQMQARLVVLPPEVLPGMLDVKIAGVRRLLPSLLGERGRWLCRQNPDWSHFLAPESEAGDVDQEALKETWEHGTIDERCRALVVLRRRDPHTARDWVGPVFSKEKPNHRARLVECFKTGLCDDDEAFMESCLSDRSAAVGQAAALLLARLPNSALAGRMRTRADAILELERTGLLVKKSRLVCTPPQEIDSQWKRDGISEQATAGQGARALWTERVLAAVPPSYWQSRFGLEPQALIAAVAADPFAASVIAGWTEAATAFAAADPASAEWLVPLWRRDAESGKTLEGRERVDAKERMRRLLAHLAPDRAEKNIEALFAPASGWEEAEVFRFVLELRMPWSERFSGAFLDNVRRRLRNQTTQATLTWANVLARRACALAPEAFPLALAPWEIAVPEEQTAWLTANIKQEIDKFIATIEARQLFMNELNA